MSDEPKDNQLQDNHLQDNHLQDNHLDALLESLLSQYSAADPRPGLEMRIVANLREAAERKRSWLGSPRWAWAGGAGAVVTAITLFLLFFSRVAQLPPPPGVVRRVAPAPPLADLRPVTGRQESIGARHRPYNRPEQSEASVRLDVFPTPVALSEQERLLLRYMAGTPRDEIMAQSRADPEKGAPEEPGDSPRDMTQVFQRASDTQ